jgi:hypothetical protein
MKLGVLSFIWASEHYEFKNIKSMMNKVGFDIIDIHWIGSHVYEPLANYYICNRKAIKKIILKNENYTLLSFYILNMLYDLFEKIFYRSALKMKIAGHPNERVGHPNVVLRFYLICATVLCK